MNLVALVHSDLHVCVRYRLLAFRDVLKSAGYSLILQELPRAALDRMRVYRTIGDVDAVILQRNLLSLPELLVLRLSAKKLIFDFDDAIWMRDSYNPRGFYSSKQEYRFRFLMRAVDAVVAGNDYLADKARECVRRAHVVTIPTCVNPDRYHAVEHRSTATVRMVWIGSQSTLQGLEQFRDCLEVIGRRVPGVRLKLICDRFLTFQNLPVDAVPWSAETETREIADADIGISWIPDDPWSCGKCGLKILQYQAAGLPVVTNPVGVHTRMVRTDETGFLPTTTEEWVNAVQHLATNVDLRRKLGTAGRQQVVTDYSVATGGRMWVAMLNQLFHQTPGGVADV